MKSCGPRHSKAVIAGLRGSPGIQRKKRISAAAPAMLAALKAIQPEMRREHDAGDGHFSTEQVETVEAAIAKAEQ